MFKKKKRKRKRKKVMMMMRNTREVILTTRRMEVKVTTRDTKALNVSKFMDFLPNVWNPNRREKLVGLGRVLRRTEMWEWWKSVNVGDLVRVV
jgi:hypothetical protein